jgi:hypothetical protein
VTFAVCLLAVLAGNAITGGAYIYLSWYFLHRRIERERELAVQLVRAEVEVARAAVQACAHDMYPPAGTYVSRGGEA